MRTQTSILLLRTRSSTSVCCAETCRESPTRAPPNRNAKVTPTAEHENPTPRGDATLPKPSLPRYLVYYVHFLYSTDGGRSFSITYLGSIRILQRLGLVSADVRVRVWNWCSCKVRGNARPHARPDRWRAWSWSKARLWRDVRSTSVGRQQPQQQRVRQDSAMPGRTCQCLERL